ncbi:MAG: LON peptidase substrate-binding domain-containing protein [Phycisphaerae bacterium]|nr:LON peptidase substrate-binding domain-containing protein [Tepidisphaeraceae bacterium]
MPKGDGVENEFPAAVPLFPLPNVVLFPRAILPLHIFEERYKQMTADVLRGHRQVAMALLRRGWERDYYGRPAVDPVVCVGTIVSHERLADGRYNFLLEGHTRARIVREIATEPYRLAELEPLTEVNSDEGGLLALRSALAGLFRRESYASLPAGRQIRELLARGVPTAVAADLAAFHLLSEHPVELRQELLGEADVRERVRRVVDAVADLKPAWVNVPGDAKLN